MGEYFDVSTHRSTTLFGSYYRRVLWTNDWWSWCGNHHDRLFDDHVFDLLCCIHRGWVRGIELLLPIDDVDGIRSTTGFGGFLFDSLTVTMLIVVTGVSS